MKYFIVLFALISATVSVRAENFVSQDFYSSVSTYTVECDETGHCYLVLESAGFKKLKSERVLVTARNSETNTWRRLGKIKGSKVTITFQCQEDAEKYLRSWHWKVESFS